MKKKSHKSTKVSTGFGKKSLGLGIGKKGLKVK